MRRRSLRLVGLAALAAALIAYGGASLVRMWQMQQEVAALEREIQALRAETDRLTADVDRLRTDPATLERFARERLGLVKPGETILKLPPTR